MEYTPIDYSKWEFTGQGKNIMGDLSPIERTIWNKVLSGQDKRDDPGHAEFVTYFSLKLLDHETADREVVIPAAILHDLGWGKMTEAERMLFKGPYAKVYNAPLRARHQEEGIKFAEETLAEVGYDPRLTQQILEIISQHDTREGFPTPEDGIMRDADKLWRFTIPEVDVSVNHRGKKLADLDTRNRNYPSKEGFFYSDTAKEIARLEWANTLRNWK